MPQWIKIQSLFGNKQHTEHPAYTLSSLQRVRRTSAAVPEQMYRPLLITDDPKKAVDPFQSHTPKGFLYLPVGAMKGALREY